MTDITQIANEYVFENRGNTIILDLVREVELLRAKLDEINNGEVVYFVLGDNLQRTMLFSTSKPDKPHAKFVRVE